MVDGGHEAAIAAAARILAARRRFRDELAARLAEMVAARGP